MYSYKLSYIIIKNHHLYCLVLNEQLITFFFVISYKLYFHGISYMSPCMFICKSYSLKLFHKLFHVLLGFLSVQKDFISFFINIAVRIHDTLMCIYTNMSLCFWRGNKLVQYCDWQLYRSNRKKCCTGRLMLQ